MLDIWEISESYTLRLINIILIAVLIGGYFFGKKYLAKWVDKAVPKKGIKIKGKEYSLRALINQVVIIISLFLLYGAIGYGNKNFSLSTFLNFELLSLNNSGDTYRLTLGQIVFVILVIFLTKITVNIVRIVLFKAFKNKTWIDEARKYTIIQLSKYVIYTICLILILEIIVGDISKILWLGSALMVGLGLGLQDFFTDLVAGFILLNDGSIQVGDIVELDGHISKVVKINIRTSHVKTTEGKTIIVPNSKFTEEFLTNWSISDKITRFNVKVAVAYGTDTSKVKELLYNVALQHPMVNKHKNIVVMFENFGENGLEFSLFFWAERTWDILVIKSDLRFAIDDVFRQNGIRIPFPQRDLHIISEQTRERPFSVKNPEA